MIWNAGEKRAVVPETGAGQEKETDMMRQEKRDRLAVRVLEACRNQLFFRYRYLEQALFRLKWRECEGITFGCDGEYLYYDSKYVLNRYVRGAGYLETDYLHTVMHCLYLHPFFCPQKQVKEGDSCWDLASDLAVECVLREIAGAEAESGGSSAEANRAGRAGGQYGHLEVAETGLPIGKNFVRKSQSDSGYGGMEGVGSGSFEAGRGDERSFVEEEAEKARRRRDILQKLQEEAGGMSAQRIYAYLQKNVGPGRTFCGMDFRELCGLFRRDEHRLWYGEDTDGTAERDGVAESDCTAERDGMEERDSTVESDCETERESEAGRDSTEECANAADWDGEEKRDNAGGQDGAEKRDNAGDQDGAEKRAGAVELGGTEERARAGDWNDEEKRVRAGDQDGAEKRANMVDRDSEEERANAADRDGAGKCARAAVKENCRRGAQQQLWKDAAGRVLMAAQASPAFGEISGNLLQNLRRLTRENYDYTEFLTKFAGHREERMLMDEDEFDYVYYTYGLKLFGKVPLVEPLEYREKNLIREFIIAIDTSGSCQGELVEGFLRKTCGILQQTECFAGRVNIHILQCDARIREDVRITSQQDLETYIAGLTLRGFGGTDFTPVFAYADELIETGQIGRLDGLVYFTDGYGKFPAKPPRYKTAFVFLDREDDVKVPPWAMKVYLEVS